MEWWWRGSQPGEPWLGDGNIRKVSGRWCRYGLRRTPPPPPLSCPLKALCLSQHGISNAMLTQGDFCRRHAGDMKKGRRVGFDPGQYLTSSSLTSSRHLCRCSVRQRWSVCDGWTGVEEERDGRKKGRLQRGVGDADSNLPHGGGRQATLLATNSCPPPIFPCTTVHLEAILDRGCKRNEERGEGQHNGGIYT